MDPSRDDLPTPIDIGAHPEITAVALLQYTIDLTGRALVTAYPELGEADFPWPPADGPAPLLAHLLLRQLDHLAALLGDYRAVLASEAAPGYRASRQSSNPF